MRYLSIVLMVILLISCKNEDKEEQLEPVQVSGNVYHGEFLHLDGRALFMNDMETYAVKVDSTMKELDQQAAQFKRSQYDMVAIKVTGELIENPFRKETGTGWEKMLVIKDIIEVQPAKTKSVMQMPATTIEENN
ncbi:component of SufBCD complex [Nonlabens ponticola]|uniref:Component of SufBCD complex n=1 Tax=Nonlabens ponticola TaxID=2496866 RepID=A0A3S9MV39_9FLAO|nr:component of SufBCD complex [Nonlabens ponticola]AZQ43044.1 component of SufBCD complex [Nonlabens ponticola]